MQLNSWGILAFFGSFILLVFFIKDWETKMNAERILGSHAIQVLMQTPI
jgi:hypothetical protein